MSMKFAHAETQDPCRDSILKPETTTSLKNMQVWGLQLHVDARLLAARLMLESLHMCILMCVQSQMHMTLMHCSHSKVAWVD